MTDQTTASPATSTPDRPAAPTAADAIARNAALPAPDLEFVFEIRCTCDGDVQIGRGADERLGFTAVVGGSVAGPRLDGTVLHSGGDWAVERSGTFELDARYVIAAADGAHIDVRNRGYYRADADTLARSEAGETIPEDQAYFRTAPVFQTDAPAHRWLAENQFIGLARDEAGQVCIRVFLVR